MYIVDHIFISNFQKPNYCSIWSVFLKLAVMFLYIVNLTHAVIESGYSIHYVLQILFSYVSVQQDCSVCKLCTEFLDGQLNFVEVIKIKYAHKKCES